MKIPHLPLTLPRAWLCILFLLGAPAAHADEVRIGVLALRGPDQAMAMWSATCGYLAGRLPEHRFRIIPLGFDQIHLAVRQRSIDFVLANPAFYVELENLYGVSPVVTVRNRHDGEVGFSEFGGVIFTRADRGDIRTIQDLTGKSLTAVDQTSFGGWLVNERELRRKGIDPESSFRSLRFLGTHDAVVYAVRDRQADAGTVRTETLERMAAEGKIRLSDYFVLNQRRVEGFPLLLSTALYPEWPLAKLRGVPDQLAVQVAVALLQMPPDDPAALASQSRGWTLPLNYQPVHDALRELHVGPYEHLGEFTPREVLARYWHWLVLGSLLALLAMGTAAYVARMNRRLRVQQDQLQTLNTGLEARVQERTERVERLLSREQFLRRIVETVAVVNDILITAASLDEMLKACCDRLVAHPDYRFAWVGLLEADGKLGLAANSYGAAVFLRMLHLCKEEGPAVRAARENVTVVTLPPDLKPEQVAEGITAVISLPLRRDAFSPPLGSLCVLTARPGGFDVEEVAMLEQLAGDIGFATHAFRQNRETQRLQQERISNYEETLHSMVDMIDKRDTYTAGHTQRVAYYCELIATRMGCSASEVENLKRAAMLHDIGKIAIPDAVLLKPGSLTMLEYDLIKQHVTVGYETLSHIDMYRELAEIMRYHHERYDGSGYPAGLRGEETPRLSRIMAVADAFDAMTTNRIYRPRKSMDVAMNELRSLAGQDFDPEVVDAALEALRDVAPPPLTDQIPKTSLERQRFAYFFNDQLTRVHNANYLQFMLGNELLDGYVCACLVMLRHFSHYNSEHGWTAGNRLLAEFAGHLTTHYPDTLVFRVMGDDFVLLSAKPLDIYPEQLQSLATLRDTPVTVEIDTLDLAGDGIRRLTELI